MTCKFLTLAAHFTPEGLDSLDVSLSPAQIQGTKPPPCFTVGTVFLSLFHLWVCEHRADVICCQKAPVLYHPSKGHTPRRFGAGRYALWKIPVWLFYDMMSSSVVFLYILFISNSDRW